MAMSDRHERNWRTGIKTLVVSFAFIGANVAFPQTSVSGKVATPNGEKVRLKVIALRKKDSKRIEYELDKDKDFDPTTEYYKYKIERLTPGEYDIGVCPDKRPEAAQYASTQSKNLAADQDTQVNFQLEEAKGNKRTGVLPVKPGERQAPRGTTVFLVNRLTGCVVASTRTTDNYGNYEFQNVPLDEKYLPGI
jgi:hypothetical protein